MGRSRVRITYKSSWMELEQVKEDQSHQTTSGRHRTRKAGKQVRTRTQETIARTIQRTKAHMADLDL
jgi:hypothetical protein